MKKVTIAFDIDGTLRCSCTETCQDTNYPITNLLEALATFKNVQLHAWSGGGKDYAWQFIRENGFHGFITEARCHSKLEGFRPDIAIDDQHEFSLGAINLICREK